MVQAEKIVDTPFVKVFQGKFIVRNWKVIAQINMPTLVGSPRAAARQLVGYLKRTGKWEAQDPKTQENPSGPKEP